tara:strand:- start:43 stop:741 length:699 start_codon:yes stop_codon:yes gene_type:complete
MWLIGFEFESNVFFKKYQVPNNFIKKYVKDKTCQIEGVSYPVLLTDEIEKRNHVFKMFEDNRRLIESPQDTNCGGHITISKEGLSGVEIFNKAKNYMGFFYSLYSNRLKSWACHSNIYLEEEKNNKFAAMKFKKNLLELRLFPHYRSLKDIFLRYKLIFELTQAIDLNLSYEEFIDNCKLLFNNQEWLNERIKESYYFKQMIDNKKYNKFTLKFMKHYPRFYEIQRLRNANQ